MPQFRKKPVVIEARQYTGQNGIELLQWVHSSDPTKGDKGFVGGVGYPIFIATLEGVMRADKGDWLIQGVNGEFYPIKPDIFAATYEAV